MWIPRLLVSNSSPGTAAIVHGWVHPDDTEDTLTARFSKRVESLRADTTRARLHERFPEPRPSPAARPQQISSPIEDRARWEVAVETAQSLMQSGELDKVVLARRRHYRQSDSALNPTECVMNLRARHSHCTTFMVRRRDGSAFVGATPEGLAELRQGVFRTVALAGTAARSPDSRIDRELGEALLSSHKERQALDRHVASLEVDASPRLKRFAHVQHLESQLEGVLMEDADIFDLLERLHPTPAMGGWPRRAALDWLRSHEEMDRGWYASPVGWVGAQGDGNFVVGIRSALIRGKDAWAYAGCGLVPESRAEAEWQETLVKFSPIGDALGCEPVDTEGEAQ